jgi:hypothetical protein
VLVADLILLVGVLLAVLVGVLVAPVLGAGVSISAGAEDGGVINLLISLILKLN